MLSKKKYSYGPDKKEQVKNVLKVLLDFANEKQEVFLEYQNSSSIFDIQNKQFFPKSNWQKIDKKLIFNTNLEQILQLLKYHENTSEIQRDAKHNLYINESKLREILGHYLGKDFLGILEDNRARKQGASSWNFSLLLYSEDTDMNMEQIDKRWKEKTNKNNGQTKNNDPYTHIPPQYKALIESKLKRFVGREFVFNAFEEFLENNPKGYFTVVGEPGIGKSAIAAKYVYDKQVPCFFNIASQGNNTTEQFKQEICSQLRQRYDILNPNNQNNLPAVLQGVSEKLKKQDKKLVIVVDALDEAQVSTEEQRSGQNILCLPQNLPNNVYFLLTRRPFNQQERHLLIDIETQREELNLNDEEYLESHRSDMRGYLEKVLEESDELGNGIRSWIEKYEINRNDFIQKLLTKSEINFMYLRYVTKDIASGAYDNIELDELPSGLEEYYRDHWRRMKMDDNDQEMQVKVLLTLVALLTKTNSKNIRVTSIKIGEYVKKHESKVYNVLQKWKQFLTESKEIEKTYYGFYHKSFLDFLEQHQIKNGPHRDLYQQIEEEICESIYGV